MPKNLETLLDRVEEELGADAWAALADAIGLDVDPDRRSGSDSNFPNDVDEAQAGEMKAGTEPQKAYNAHLPAGEDGDTEERVPEDAVTESDLDARLEELREELLLEEDLAEVVDDLEASAQEALAEALPGVVEDVGEKMASGGRGYVDEVQETYGLVRTAPGFEAGRTPAGTGRGTQQKLDSGDSGGESYREQIQDTFAPGEGER